MCAYPPSLFEVLQMLWKVAKAELAKAILRHMQEQESVSMVEVESNVESNNCIQERVWDVENNDHTQYVLDRGSLLHRRIWKNNSTYEEIAESFPGDSWVSSMLQLFLMDATVPKDMTHEGKIIEGISANPH